VFYTKYRPQKFEELFGLESVTKALTTQLKKNQVGHAYLFAGPRGTGKTTVARILAREVGCRGMDLIEIDAASNRGIDDVRRLREGIGLAPSGGPKKVYIIDEAHMLTREAFNALLKTLEEPPAHAILILATTEPQKIPETVRSRCQRFDFGRASTKDIVRKLKFIAQKEKAQASDE
jgi:DNA polymerase-3 subunit gamma/tau